VSLLPWWPVHIASSTSSNLSCWSVKRSEFARVLPLDSGDVTAHRLLHRRRLQRDLERLVQQHKDLATQASCSSLVQLKVKVGGLFLTMLVG
jgi:hypothetical protein